jgi:hypothetical protein
MRLRPAHDGDHTYQAPPAATSCGERLATDPQWILKAVPTILAFGLAAAVYPQLLAVVVVILTRPGARRLLWACYLGAASVSVGSGIAVLLVFRDRGTVVGSTAHRLGASVYLVVGALAVLIAILVVRTERGRTLAGGGVKGILPRRRRAPDAPGATDRLKVRAQEALGRGSTLVALAVGVALGIPGPFDPLALGRLARGGYSLLGSIAILVVFNLLKFLLIEIPLMSYTLEPERTAARVDRFSAWMKAHRIEVIAAVVAIVGLVLIGRGVSRLG